MAEAVRRVGVIGLGKMGLPMARHMAAKGFEVVGYDPLSQARGAAEAAGARALGSPAEVAGASDLAIVIVGFDKQVDDVLFGADGLLAGARPGLTVAVASTVPPSYVRTLPKRAAGTGVTFLDIPIARGEQAAEDGTLLLFGGGEAAAFERCRPAFDAFSEVVVHLGDLGAGQVGKMVNNMILWACLVANVEGLDLAESLGVDRERLRAALQHSSGDNWALRTRADERGALWAEKDMMIVLAEADRARLALPLCGSIKEAVKAFKVKRGLPMPTLDD